MGHFKEKVRHNTFSIKISAKPITEPCRKNQHQGWKVTYQNWNLGVTIFKLYPFNPCYPDGLLRICTSDDCEIHSYGKIREWNKWNEGTYDCQAHWHGVCRETKCQIHRDEKITDWQYTKNHEQSQKKLDLLRELVRQGFNMETHEGATNE